MDEKWEHKIALEYVKSSEKVLEIGCARGGFLKQLRKKNVTADGLEMNSDALNESKKIGLSVYSDSIETFSQKKISSYDMVCSFQVLEHVADVKSFLDASLASLKRGGRMIISVPNNDSIIMDTDDGGLLNGPPHHMGRWNMNSLIALQNHFNIRVESIHLEPLQKYHLAYALRMANTNVAKKLLKKVGFLSPLFTKASHLITYAGISAVSKYIVGHSIVIVFKKQ
jgi:2-polyprenyl-3-methyl-5-hydroxy-6-metoxy-1,4-benzoquinol methylase